MAQLDFKRGMRVNTPLGTGTIDFANHWIVTVTLDGSIELGNANEIHAFYHDQIQSIK